jgi:hypothetical protein
MCRTVWAMNEPNPMVHGVDDLMALVGATTIRDIEDFTDEGVKLTTSECLCSVHVAECLVAYGFRVWKEPDGDSMEYMCERIPSPPDPTP